LSKSSCVALTLLLQRILRSLALRHVDNAVHVEADLLRVRRPVLVAEAVLELAVMCRSERVVTGADRTLVDFECVGGVLDLC
jgi:hypothetical protein